MSERRAKILALHPRWARGPRLRRRLIPFTVVLILILLAVSLYLFREELDLDRVRRYFHYLGVERTGSYGVWHFDAHNANDYAVLEDGLAVASVAGLDVYGPSGEELASASASVGAPALETGGELALLWDVGGTVLAAANGDGVKLDLQLDRPLLDADISRSGEICYASAADGYRTVLTVLDAAQQQRYQWLSSSQYLPLCAIGEGGRALAAVAVGQEGGAFFSRLQLFDTGSEDPGPSIPLGGQMIYDLDFLDRDTICAVGEESVLFFDASGAKLGEYSYGSDYLKDFCLSAEGYALLSLSPYQAGSRCDLVAIGADGAVLARVVLEEGMLSLDANGRYTAVLTTSRLHVYAGALELYYETAEVSGASEVAVRGDGTALLIGGSEARLYVP